MPLLSFLMTEGEMWNSLVEKSCLEKDHCVSQLWFTCESGCEKECSNLFMGTKCLQNGGTILMSHSLGHCGTLWMIQFKVLINKLNVLIKPKA